MAKKQLEWSVSETQMTVNFINAVPVERVTFKFEDIKEYVAPVGIVAALFRHGLKQMLADSVAGAGKRGDKVSEQIATMNGVWDAIKSGVKRERANAKEKLPKITEEMVRANAAALGQDADAMVNFMQLMGLLK